MWKTEHYCVRDEYVLVTRLISRTNPENFVAVFTDMGGGYDGEQWVEVPGGRATVEALNKQDRFVVSFRTPDGRTIHNPCIGAALTIQEEVKAWLRAAGIGTSGRRMRET